MLSSLPIQDRKFLGEFFFSKDVAYDQFKAVRAATKIYNLIILQGVPEEVFELDFTVSYVSKPLDSLPFYLLISIHEFVQGSDLNWTLRSVTCPNLLIRSLSICS